MKPSRFTEKDVLEALRQVRAGAAAVTVCRNLGITQTTFYRWRKQYGEPPETEVREVRRLRRENQKLKQIVANLLLEKIP
jgi:putative transposase